MLSGKKPKPSRHLPGLGGMSVAGGIIGVVSSLVGIGGGTLSVPFLLWNNLDMRKAIGTSAAIGFPIALAGCFGYIVNGWNAANLPPYSVGYIYLPSLFGIVVVSMFTAPLGARLAQTLPVPRPDAALLWWDGRYWLSVPGNAEQASNHLSEFGRCEERCPHLEDVDTSIDILRHLGCAVRWNGPDLEVDSSTLSRWDIPDRLMRRMGLERQALGAVSLDDHVAGKRAERAERQLRRGVFSAF